MSTCKFCSALEDKDNENQPIREAEERSMLVNRTSRGATVSQDELLFQIWTKEGLRTKQIKTRIFYLCLSGRLAEDPNGKVRKWKNGKVRLCGDFKVTLNPQLMIDQYPLSRIEDILSSLSEGEKFTKLDLRQEMSEESKKYLTINTLKGLYQFNRLVFGVASASAMWQRLMEQILQGIPGVEMTGQKGCNRTK